MSSHFSSLLETLARRPFARPLKPPPLVRLGTSLRKCRSHLHTTPFLLSAFAGLNPPLFILRFFSNARPSASKALARSPLRPSLSLRAGGLSLRALPATCQRHSRFQSPSWSITSPLPRLRSPRHRPAVLPPRASPRSSRTRGPLVLPSSLKSRLTVLRCVSVTATTFTRCLSTMRHSLQLSRAISLCRPLCPPSPRPVAHSSPSCSEERWYPPRRELVRSRSDGL